MVKKITTIEGLAIMTQNGFIEIHKKFETVDKRFETVDKRFKSIDSRFDSLEERMNDGFEHVHARLSNIERDVAEIRKHFVYRDEFEDLMNRVKYLELKLNIQSGK